MKRKLSVASYNTSEIEYICIAIAHTNEIWTGEKDQIFKKMYRLKYKGQQGQ